MRRSSILPLGLGLALGGLTLGASAAYAHRGADAPYLTTETLYHFEPPAHGYEAPPPGYTPVFTELVARHGARGASSEGADLAAYAMWQAAQAAGALTPLGEQLGPDLLAFIRANTILGAGVAGITTPGYGNVSRTGAEEHAGIAHRLVERLRGYFRGLPAAGRRLVVETSGVNRAYDSAGYFVDGLVQAEPSLAPLVTYPPAVSGYGTKPKAQLPGTNRFLLYFHKLTAAQDLVSDPADPYYATYQASLAYQHFKASDPIQTAKVAELTALPAVGQAAQHILLRLFRADFVAALGQDGHRYSDSGSFTFSGADGKSYTTVGSGGTTIASAVDAASALQSVYVIVPALQHELGGLDFSRYLPPADAAVLGYQGDAIDYYQMGPGAREDGDATFAMARALRDDFFLDVDQVAAGDRSTGAKLRFTHAEIVEPFTSSLQLPPTFVQLPAAETFTYDWSSPWNGELQAPRPAPWRDERVAPMAANVQWEVYGDRRGHLLVKMLLDEEEVDFKPDCDGARRSRFSHYYDYAKLRACYAD